MRCSARKMYEVIMRARLCTGRRRRKRENGKFNGIFRDEKSREDPFLSFLPSGERENRALLFGQKIIRRRKLKVLRSKGIQNILFTSVIYAPFYWNILSFFTLLLNCNCGSKNFIRKRQIALRNIQTSLAHFIISNKLLDRTTYQKSLKTRK